MFGLIIGTMISNHVQHEKERRRWEKFLAVSPKKLHFI